ncbi:alpha-galactosidase-1 [Coleophoma crateriformis]|uniref:Alpha-galactosidase n=1 Tax=Coleophoma crateriformis TaxID=565419 RepID=A0A3D8QYY4_9HELO|nr:alpha-galactosidase-1 [Coleophoma crateriformis]
MYAENVKWGLLLDLFSFLGSNALSPRLDNGLALTPPMGWNSYNHYSCSPNESIIHSNAQALVDFGLDTLGYHYVTIDCGWTLPNRTANGTLTWSPERFPNGYPAMGEFIHSLGLGFGVYSDGGVQMCMTGDPVQTGSLGYEQIDAATFTSWGADLLKYDNCFSDAALDYPDVSYTPSTSPQPHYISMSAAVTAQPRPMIFQICDWGVDFPSLWAPDLGNTWRITNDITGVWSTIPRILNQAVPQTSFAGPGHWLDLDMLQVGNDIFTVEEEKTHFTTWAILKSPLTIGGALKDSYTIMSEASLAILSNEDVISYNQDSLGVAASLKRKWTEEGYEVWAGPLSGERMVIALINWMDVERNLTLDFPVVGIQKAGTLKDVWGNVTQEDVVTSYESTIGAHGVMLLEVGNLTAEGIYDVSDATISEDGTTATFSQIYGLTTSSNYTAQFSFPTNTTDTTVVVNSISYKLACNSTMLTIPLSLSASSQNILSVNPPPKTLQITAPGSNLYPSTLFTTLTGNATETSCLTDLCQPVGSKISFLGGPTSNTASAIITVPSAGNGTAGTGHKYVEVYFCNNDIALATSWTTGTNTRNLTIGVNGVVTRIEVPLAGRSSELFSPGKGWMDTGIFGVLLDGWKEGENEVVVGNVGGEMDVQSWAADFVGLGVVW